MGKWMDHVVGAQQGVMARIRAAEKALEGDTNRR